MTRRWRAGGLVRPGARQRFQRRLRGRIGAEIGGGLAGGAGGDEDRAAGVGLLQQRLHAADQLEIRGDVDRHHVVPRLQFDMAERRGRTGDAGIADKNVELAVALVQRRAEPGDAVVIGEVERHQRGAAAVFADLVVELFQPALRPRHRHHMRAGLCQRARGGIADAARGAGDESDAGGEGVGHGSRLSVMPGLVPGIHVICGGFYRRGWPGQARP